MYKIVEFSHLLIKDYIENHNNKDLILVDATCGAGNDTLFMANCLNNRGRLIAYDIQEIAINTTKSLIEKNGFNNIVYKLESHEYITEIPDLVIYNFGYLPNGDKSITTKAETSLKSVSKMINLINQNPELLIILVLYPGHSDGLVEAQEIDKLCLNLSGSDYLVCKYQNYNRITSPFVITISKSKKSH